MKQNALVYKCQNSVLNLEYIREFKMSSLELKNIYKRVQ